MGTNEKRGKPSGGYDPEGEVKVAAPGAAGGHGESPAASHSTPTYYTVRDVARYLRVHEGTVRRWISERRLLCMRMGNGKRPGIRITDQQLNDFVTIFNPC